MNILNDPYFSVVCKSLILQLSKATQQHMTANDKLENDFEVKNCIILALFWRG
jgi:hypothetical protein